MLTAKQASRDVTLLRRALETVNPGLYCYSDRRGVRAIGGRRSRADQ